MNGATLVRKNLFRKKLRAILLLFSILIAFLIFAVLGAFNKTLNAGVETAAADRLVTVNKINFTVSMPYAYWGRVASVEGVKNVSQANWFGGYYQEPRNFVQTFAVDPETYMRAYPELEFTQGSAEAFFNNRQCLAVGADLALQYEWNVGERVPLNSNIWQQQDGTSDWDFDICAIFDAEDDNVPANYALFHYEYFNESLAFNRDQVGWLIINTEDPSMNDAVSQRIDAMFANSPAETETTTEAAFSKAFIEQLGNIGLIITLVTGAAFATILMIVGTTMVMAINERTREIAVMKTIGFPAPRIFRMVLSESLLLSLIGGLLGIGLAASLIWLMSQSPAVSGSLPGLSVGWRVTFIGIGFMIALGLITGLIPAWNAMRANIAEAFGKV
ncbi:ABC transporter permease [Euryhalocaulis caribicus]|uniref:ABC transporter permease n=1 Tax=Euryhalocaulis caribicus TaxID=1161401 RepID=UPI0003A02B74|nr:FtsX-like permease family protein [Euryhalocaulis caribicus]